MPAGISPKQSDNKISQEDCVSWLDFYFVPDYSPMCSFPNTPFTISHWSPAKTEQPPSHHNGRWACFLPSCSTPRWWKHPLTHPCKTKPRKRWGQQELTWKIPRHKHRCEDRTLWGRESRDNRQRCSLLKGAGVLHGEHGAAGAKGIPTPL